MDIDAGSYVAGVDLVVGVEEVVAVVVFGVVEVGDVGHEAVEWEGFAH